METCLRLLRRLLPVVLLTLLPPVATAQPGESDYDALLRALAAASGPAEADQIVPRIWRHWLTAPDPAAQEVLDAALERRAAYDYLGALRHLDRLVADYPDYAEGWNQRATIYFLVGEFEASLRDVRETLAREPRHFGALAGRAMIYYQQGKIALAQLSVREALKFHPFLAERAILDLPVGDDI